MNTTNDDIIHSKDLIHETFALIPLLNRKIMNPSRPTLPPGITPRHLQILMMIRSEQPIRMLDLAARMGVSKQELNTQMHALEAKGLVRRDTDPSNRRSVLASLTTGGVAFLDGIDAQLVEKIRPGFACFSSGEKEEFQKTVEKLTSYLERMP